MTILQIALSNLDKSKCSDEENDFYEELLAIQEVNNELAEKSKTIYGKLFLPASNHEHRKLLSDSDIPKIDNFRKICELSLGLENVREELRRDYFNLLSCVIDNFSQKFISYFAQIPLFEMRSLCLAENFNNATSLIEELLSISTQVEEIKQTDLLEYTEKKTLELLKSINFSGNDEMRNSLIAPYAKLLKNKTHNDPNHLKSLTKTINRKISNIRHILNGYCAMLECSDEELKKFTDLPIKDIESIDAMLKNNNETLRGDSLKIANNITLCNVILNSRDFEPEEIGNYINDKIKKSGKQIQIKENELEDLENNISNLRDRVKEIENSEDANDKAENANKTELIKEKNADKINKENDVVTLENQMNKSIKELSNLDKLKDLKDMLSTSLDKDILSYEDKLYKPTKKDFKAIKTFYYEIINIEISAKIAIEKNFLNSLRHKNNHLMLEKFSILNSIEIIGECSKSLESPNQKLIAIRNQFAKIFKEHKAFKLFAIESLKFRKIIEEYFTNNFDEILKKIEKPDTETLYVSRIIQQNKEQSQFLTRFLIEQFKNINANHFNEVAQRAAKFIYEQLYVLLGSNHINHEERCMLSHIDLVKERHGQITTYDYSFFQNAINSLAIKLPTKESLQCNLNSAPSHSISPKEITVNFDSLANNKWKMLIEAEKAEISIITKQSIN